MSGLKFAMTEHAAWVLIAGGFLIGMAFGAIARWTNFCTMGALSDWRVMGDTRRLRAWVLAAGVATLGATALEWAGVTDLSLSIYQGRTLDWANAILGGTLFGIGMALAGGCPSRNLVRAGGGDLRALLTLVVIALFAEMTLGGIFGPMRVALSEATMTGLGVPRQSLGDLAAQPLGLSAPVSRFWAGILAGLALVVFAMAGPAFRGSLRHIASGLGIGLAVVAAWAVTGLTYDEMGLAPERPQAVSFVKPTADTLEWLGRSTAKGLPGFAIMIVAGVIAGSFLATAVSRSFRLVTFAGTGDTLRHLSGAALMGAGGIMGLGCSIGQGLSGVSTLSIGSLLATGGIIGGTILGLKALERWLD